MVKHRGISYLDDASDDGNSSVGDYAQIVKENSKQLETKTPGQIQLERYQKYGQLRGDFTVEEDGKKHRLINVFPTSAYRAEALRILQTQQEFNSQITDEFINRYLEILTGKRKYYHGPGNEKSRTDYGRYRTSGETLDNIFGILIGKCTFYPEEFRAAKASYTAQEFNLLNDLNNLTVPTETKKLSEEQKNQIINYVKNEKAMGPAKLFKYIAKLLSCDIADIKGYRIDKSDKAEIHTFEAYRKMKTLETIDIEKMSREELDKLAYVLTLNTEREGIQEALEHEFVDGNFSQEQIDELVQFRKANSSIFGKGWHNFSVKLMMELIPELYATSEEQMTILTRLGKQKTTSSSNKTKYIDEKLLTEEIYNPVVAKSVRQAIKIVNAAIKEYGDFDNIVIEMARATNEDDEKKAIQKIQKANKDEKDAAMLKAANQYNGKAELPHSVFHGHKQLATKIRLWHQQGERCLYTGKTISIHDLINNPNQFEIDHILPLSITFDDSLANKVLVYATANQEKGQRTPYQALDSMDDAWSFRELKAFVRESKTLSNKKKEYLLTEEDISKFDVRKKFIERNLVDTRYASRVVLNALQEHFRAHKIDTKVSVVRGQFTSQLRRHWGIEKTRDTYHHHAVDALIIAASSQLNLWKKQKNTLVNYSENQLLDIETGELISDDEYKESVFKAVSDNGQAGGEWSSISEFKASNANLGKEYPADTSFVVTGKLEDRFSVSEFQTTVPTDKIIMSYDQQGVGIGKYRENGALDVDGLIYSGSKLIQHHKLTEPNGAAIDNKVDNLNDYRTTGFYSILGNYKNHPASGEDACLEVVESISGYHQTLTTVSGRMFKRTVTSNSNGSWIEYTPKPAMVKQEVDIGWRVKANLVRQSNVVTLSLIRDAHSVPLGEYKGLSEKIPSGFKPCVQTHLVVNKNVANWHKGCAVWHLEPNGNMYFSNQDSENAVYTGTVTYITEDEYPIEK